MTESWTSRGSEVVLGRFILDLLLENQHTDILQWTDPVRCEFKFLRPQEIARRWGEFRGKSDMNYDKFSRSIRYHYGRGILEKVDKEKFSYRFLNLDEPTRMRILAICRENQATGRTSLVPPRSYHRFLSMLGNSASPILPAPCPIYGNANKRTEAAVEVPTEWKTGASGVDCVVPNSEGKPGLDQTFTSPHLMTPRRPSIIHHGQPKSPSRAPTSSNLTLSPVPTHSTSDQYLAGLGLKRKAPGSPVASTPKIQRLEDPLKARRRFVHAEQKNEESIDGSVLLQSCLSLPAQSSVSFSSGQPNNSGNSFTPMNPLRNPANSHSGPSAFSTPTSLPSINSYSSQAINPYSAQAFLSACTAIGMETLMNRLHSPLSPVTASPYPALPSPMPMVSSSSGLPQGSMVPNWPNGQNLSPFNSPYAMSPPSFLGPYPSPANSLGSAGYSYGSSSSSGSSGSSDQQFPASPFAALQQGMSPLLWNRFQSPSNGRF